MRPTAWLFLAAAFALLAACDEATETADEPLDAEGDVFLQEPGKADSNGIEDHGYDATCVLRLVNRAGVDELDDDARLWGVAARGIVAHRDGRDGRPGTADDQLFTSLDTLDGVSWVGYFAFQRLLSHAKRAGDCPALFEEYVPAGEDAAIAAVTAAGQTHIQGQYDAGDRPARRDAHPKAHGCVQASFQVDPSLLPANQQVGLFAAKGDYPAWIRFSNGSFSIQHDKDGDIRGMAIKVMGVDGDKILENERDAKTQDFLMINSPTLMVRNALDYVEFSQKAFDGNPVSFFFSLNPLEWQLRELSITLRVLAKKIASPLKSRYWSTTPYRLGETAMKYSARPCDGESDDRPADLTKDYLADVMAAELAQRPACFEFMVQTQRDPETMPIEDPTLEWDDEDAPFVPVAVLTVPTQTFRSAEQQAFCEHLSFTPWHSLPEHRPIGGINRVRRVVYEAISSQRHSLNGVPRVEPSGF